MKTKDVILVIHRTVVILGLLALYVPASNASAATAVRCVKRAGSGLGLSIAKRVIAQAAAKVASYPSPGKLAPT